LKCDTRSNDLRIALGSREGFPAARARIQFMWVDSRSFADGLFIRQIVPFAEHSDFLRPSRRQSHTGKKFLMRPLPMLIAFSQGSFAQKTWYADCQYYDVF
jgi:hypothetical protein